MEPRILQSKSFRKKIRANLPAFIALILCACQLQNQSDAPVKNHKLLIQLEALKEKSLEFFWKEIEFPSFLYSRDIHWSCAERDAVLVVEWTQQKTYCKDLLLPPEVVDSECVHEKKFKTPIRSCETPSIESTMSSIRFSSLDSYYQTQKPPFIPNPYHELEKKWHFPVLDFVAQNAELVFPTLDEWLQASDSKNLLIASLNPINSTAPQSSENWATFLEWYSQIEAPRKIKWIANTSQFLKNADKKNLKNMSFYPKLSTHSTFPLVREFCAYVDQWLMSRYVLEGRKVEKQSVLEINCDLSPLNSAMANSIEITRFPLPLITSMDRQFPFARRDNLLDESIWNTLGALQ
jgi:hypothetical protein